MQGLHAVIRDTNPEGAMEVLYPRCSGLDVHKDEVVACARIAEGRKVEREVSRFGTTTRELLRLQDWLRERRVSHVAMESTGVYWKPVWHVLEGEFELVLGNAKEMRNVPGRKTDQNDAMWIADLQAHGLIRNSYIPPEPVQELRDLTRTRKQLVRERAQHVQRIQKVLEDANVKLSSVVTDVMGLSGRTILTAIVRGEDDPTKLARLAHPQVKASQEKLAEALQGRVRDHHRYMIQLHLDQIESLETAVGSVEARLDTALDPFREQIERLCTIPGVSETVAAVIVAECGGEVSAFPTADHLVAWAGLAPRQNETAGKRKSVRTKRQRWLKTTLVQAAHAAVKKRDSYLRSKYYRIRARRGSKKAIVAIAAAMLRAAYHILERGEDYADLGAEYYDHIDRKRATNRLIRRLEGLGYEVNLKAAA
jgi:transposase